MWQDKIPYNILKRANRFPHIVTGNQLDWVSRSRKAQSREVTAKTLLSVQFFTNRQVTPFLSNNETGR
jgi:hypothetical protein